MHTILVVVLVLTMISVLGVLLAGVVGLARGSDPVRSNTLMRWRIVLQAAALVIFALLVTVLRN